VLSFDRRLQTLLTAAAKTFADQGFHATSMRDLSRASGLSLAGIYHYVDSKVELLYLIQDRCFEQVLVGAHAAVGAETDPRARLLAYIRHHVVFFAGHMNEMKVLSHEYEELTGTMRAEVRRRKREYAELLLGLLEAVDAPAVSRQVAAYALFGMMNWIYTWYHPTGTIAPDTLAEEMALLFLNGYCHPATQAAAMLVANSGG
jgi:AcrR family transcriptional regulator